MIKEEAKLTPLPNGDDKILESYYEDTLNKVRELYNNGELGFEPLYDKVSKLIEDYWIHLIGEYDEMKKFLKIFLDYRDKEMFPSQLEQYIKVTHFTGIWLRDNIIEIEYILKYDPSPEKITHYYEEFWNSGTGKIERVYIGINWPQGVYKIMVPLKDD